MIIADLSCSGIESDILSGERNVFGITHCQGYEAACIKCLGMSESYHMPVMPSYNILCGST